MKIFIYKIYFPTSKKCYIGQTNNLQARLCSHLDSKYLIGNALRKYDDWEVSILHTVKDRDAANLLEIEEIRNFNSVAPNGYNLTRGGEGNNYWEGKSFSKEHIEKLSKSKKGKKNFYMQGNQHGRANRGKKRSKEFCENQKGNKYGEGKRSKEFCENLKENKNSPDISGGKNPMRVPINVLKQRFSKLQNGIKKLEKELNNDT